MNNLLNKVRASLKSSAAAKSRVAAAKVVAAASSKTLEEQLAEEGLAVFKFSSVGEDRYGNDAPLFVDEFTNPAPGTEIIWDARDQVAMSDADESADFRRAYPTSVTACDDRWEAYLAMTAEIANAGRSAYAVFKHVQEVVNSQRAAIFGGQPSWDKALKAWKLGNIVASASDERLPLTAGHLRALKALALDVGGHGCKGCESLEGVKCWDHQALIQQGKGYADYLLRRKEQALKLAPVRAFTDLPEVVEEIIPGIRSRGPAIMRRKALIGPRLEGDATPMLAVDIAKRKEQHRIWEMQAGR
jgi:hypothetical protein